MLLNCLLALFLTFNFPQINSEAVHFNHNSLPCPNGESCSLANPYGQIFTQCEVTEEVLLEIQRILAEAYDAATTPPEIPDILEYDDKCKIPSPESNRRKCSTVLSEECEQLIDGILDMVKTLRDEIILLLQSVVDLGSYEAMKSILEGRIRNLNETLLNLNENFAQNYTELWSHIFDQQQCYVDEVNKRIEEAEILKSEVEQKTLQLVATYIWKEKLSLAYSNFLTLRNDSRLHDIMLLAYDIDEIEKILKFSELLNQNQKQMYFKTLYCQMEKKGHLDTTAVIQFYQIMKYQSFPGDVTFPQCTTLWPEVVREVTTRFERIINSWTNTIKDGKGGEVAPLVSKDQIIIRNAYEAVIPDLIKRVYENKHDVMKNICKFINGLGWNLHKYLAIKTLDELKKDNDEHLIVALLVESALNSPPSPDPVKRTELEQIRNGLDPKARDLVFHTSSWGCQLTNHWRGERLYVANGDRKHDDTSYGVYTWIPNEMVCESIWYFSPKWENDKYVFEIRNNRGTGKFYLCSHLFGARYDGKIHSAATSSMQSNYCKWELEFAPRTDRIRLKNVETNSYLFLSGHEFNCNRRRPLMHTLDPYSSAYEWIMRCSDSPNGLIGGCH